VGHAYAWVPLEPLGTAYFIYCVGASLHIG